MKPNALQIAFRTAIQEKMKKKMLDAGRQKITENSVFHKNDKRVMNALRKLPKVKEMAKILLRYLMTKCRVEEYGVTTPIEYGANPKEIDFLYVLRGEMIF